VFRAKERIDEELRSSGGNESTNSSETKSTKNKSEDI